MKWSPPAECSEPIRRSRWSTSRVRFQNPARLPTLQVAQKDMAFLPALLPVQVGTKVEFPNLEKDTYHNIFSYSPAKRFDLGRYRPDEKPVPSEIFDVAGLLTLRGGIY